MNLIDYQKWTLSTAIYPGAGEHEFPEALYLVLGLASEAGEVAGKLKKIVRGDKTDPVAFIDECGDVLWYLARICDNVGITLEDLAELNHSKLSKRKDAGTIQGEGDNR